MAGPGRMSVDLSISDTLPISETYEAREQERTRAYLEGIHGPIPIDATEEGLAKSADAAAEKGGKRGLTPNAESTSEAVRATSEAQQITDDNTPQAAEGLARLLGFKDMKDARSKLSAGIGIGDAMKFTDVPGNVGEALSRAQAQSFGLPDDLVESIATAGGLASVLFPTPGGAGKVAKALKGAKAKVVEVAPDLRERVIKALKDQRGALGPGPEAASGAGTTAAKVDPGAEALRDLAKRYTADVAKQRRGVRSHEEAMAEAEALKRSGMTLDDVRALMPGAALNDAEAVATILHLEESGRTLKALAKQVMDGDETALTPMLTQLYLHAQIDPQRLGVIAESGRTLSVMNDPVSGLNAFLKQFEELLAGGQGLTPTRVAELIASFKTPEDLVKVARKITQPGALDAIYEYWINSLLSGPQTHTGNLGAGVLTTMWAPYERFMSALLDPGQLTGNRGVYYGESFVMLYGGLEGAKDGFRLVGKQIAEESKQLSGRPAKFVAQAFGPDKLEHAPAITKALVAQVGLNPEGAIGGAVDYLGSLIRASGRALMTEDTFVKAVNYRMELRAGAYRDAAAQGLRGKEFAKAVASTIKDPPPAIKTRAEQFALTNTLNREFEDLSAAGTYGLHAGEIGSGVAHILNAVPLGRVIGPFIRVAANDLHWASERTPILNLISDTLRADLFSGNPARRAEALGKIGAGATASALIATYAATPIDAENPMAYMTMITGEGPRDPGQRAALVRLGWQPYSGWNFYSKEYLSFRRLAPVGTILGIVATTTEMIGQLSEQGKKELAQATAIATGKSMWSKSFLHGLSEFFDAMEGDLQDFDRFFQSLARTGVPVGVRQLTRELDPIKRDMDSLFDHWRSGLPGYDGPAEVNLWGDEVMFSGGLGPDIASPIYTSRVKPDEVDEWLIRNEVTFGRTPRAVGPRPPGDTKWVPGEGDKPVKITKEERHRLAVLIGKGGDAGSIGLDLGVLENQPPLKDVIRKLITGPGTDGPGGSRADMVRSVVHDRKAMAIMQLRRESPDLDDELKRREKQRIQNKIPQAPAFAPGLVIPGR